MTLRTVTYDDSKFKIVPIKLGNELTSLLADVIDDPENDRSSWDLAENIHAVLIASAPEYQEPDLVNFNFEQNWANVDGAIAWHLIDRHADGWAEVGRMMNDWLKANQEPKKDK